MEYLMAVILGGIGVVCVIAGVNGSASSLFDSITGGSVGSGAAAGSGNPLAGLKLGQPLGTGAIPGEHPAPAPSGNRPRLPKAQPPPHWNNRKWI